MELETTRTNETTNSQNLYMAIELSSAQWKLGFTVGLAQAPRLRSLEARDLFSLDKEISLAKERFGLLERCAVLSYYPVE